VKRVDIAVSFEISGIERQQTLDSVDIHHSNEAGIINPDALDSVVSYDLFPCGVDRRNVR